MAKRDEKDKSRQGMDMQDIKHYPRFAVVGHPNKGKSSVVSSLSFDDSIQISDTSGTTRVKRSFPLKVDSKTLYEIYDTPGFQRPRRVLAWLESHDVSADERPSIVSRFIEEHRSDERFRDEIELLEPIMDGAGIIFVVDGSKPYGDEYESEMEILRWTAQPSMALINHIENSDYEEQWRRALSQYFRLVRVYNPMKRTFQEHLKLLESIAQLKEQWTTSVTQAIEILKANRDKKFDESVLVIYDLMRDALSHVERMTLSTDKSIERQKEIIKQRYEDHIRGLEQKSQKSIERIWQHKYLKKEQENLPFIDMDLFSSQSESIFGLSRQELLTMGVVAGVATGASTDLLSAGQTMMLGSVIGGVMGGVGAYFGFDKMSKTKVLGQKIGKRYIEIGPIKNRNFTYILMGRAIYHASSIMSRSHAVRTEVRLDKQGAFSKTWLNDKNKKIFEKQHKLFSSNKSIKKEQKSQYLSAITSILRVVDHKSF